MKKIYKYPINPGFNGVWIVDIPQEATFLYAGLDPTGQLCMWWEIDPDEEATPCTFCIVGTGQEYDPNEWVYLQTVQDGRFMWHLFSSSKDIKEV